MEALNQTYRLAETFKCYPGVREWYYKFRDLYNAGRLYDMALTMYQLKLDNAIVYETAARASRLGAYLSTVGKRAHVSDNFEWMNDFDGQCEVWRKASNNSPNLFCEFQDATALPYPDESADVVICLSALEHMFYEDDIYASEELGRVCAPGGALVLSVEVGETYIERVGGCRLYTEKEIFERIVEPSGCEMYGPHNFDFASSDIITNSHFGVPYVSAFFILRKPYDSRYGV